MIDELIKYDTALLAQEKGFDVQTYANCWVKTLDGDIIHNSETYSCLEHDRAEQFLLQPTQGVLQRWLREVHNLHIEVKVMDSVTKVEYYWSVFGQYNDTRFIRCLVNSPIENYTSYEIALEIALQEALKLIE